MKKQKSIFLSEYDFDQIKDQAIIIDVRTKNERKILPCIANDRHCYFQDLIDNCDVMFPNKNTLLVTYCNSGNRSSIAAEALKESGFWKYFCFRTWCFWMKTLFKKTKIN